MVSATETLILKLSLRKEKKKESSLGFPTQKHLGFYRFNFKSHVESHHSDHMQ